MCVSVLPADSATVSAVHQEDGSESPGNAEVRRLADQNHYGLHELEQQHTRLHTHTQYNIKSCGKTLSGSPGTARTTKYKASAQGPFPACLPLSMLSCLLSKKHKGQKN